MQKKVNSEKRLYAPVVHVEVERIARELCKLRGADPDEVVELKKFELEGESCVLSVALWETKLDKAAEIYLMRKREREELEKGE